jgi:hypothetical protein
MKRGVQGGCMGRGVTESENTYARRQGRMFFFEKKNQKTFANWPRSQTQAVGPDSALREQKFFGSFFKKEQPPSARRHAKYA